MTKEQKKARRVDLNVLRDKKSDKVYRVIINEFYDMRPDGVYDIHYANTKLQKGKYPEWLDDKGLMKLIKYLWKN